MPMPSSARNRNRNQNVGAKPATKLQTEYQAIEIISGVLRPTRSASQPEAQAPTRRIQRVMVNTAVTSVSETLNSLAIGTMISRNTVKSKASSVHPSQPAHHAIHWSLVGSFHHGRGLAVSTIAASPWRAGLTSPTAPLTKRAGAPSFCSSRADARPMTSPDSRRSLAESIVPWMAKFHTSASGAPARVVSFSTTISWSSGLPSRLAVTAGAVTLVVAASAGTRARSAPWTADTAPATSASLTARSSRSTATRPISPELMNAPGPECVCDADTTSALDGTPARARRSWTAATSA